MKKFAMSAPNFAVSQLFRKLGFTEEHDTDKRPDFYVFCGGPDVSPSLYFHEQEPKTYVDLTRDYQDLCTLAAARLHEIPCVGICRGLQFLHVSLGGTLIQHMEGHAGSIHQLLDEDGRLIKGWENVRVNSTHHQGIPLEECIEYDQVYTSPDLNVEAFVALEKFTMGVQYHPEYANCPEEGVEFFAEMMKHSLEGLL
jgi:putative glutamine amidotransferase